MLISTICRADAPKQANTRTCPFTENNMAPRASKGRAPLLCVTAQIRLYPQIRLLSLALLGSLLQAGGPRGFVSHTSCHSHKELLGLSREAQISVEVQHLASLDWEDLTHRETARSLTVIYECQQARDFSSSTIFPRN